MTKLYKRLGVGLAAAALLLGLAGLQGAGQAEAQTNPPATFAGTVMIDGEDAPAGTAITAMMGETTCATGQTGRGLNNSAIDANRYALQISQDDCSGEISFMVGEMMAAETAMMDDGVGQVGTANLTAMSAMPTEEPTAEPTAMATEEPGDEPAEPGGDDTAMATEEPAEPGDDGAMETETAMPTDDNTDDTAMGGGDEVVAAPSDTGTGLASGAGSATTTLAAALGALALAVTLGGLALARRRG